jgi:hypothetical protein
MHDPLIRRLASNGKVKSAATRGPGFSWPGSAPQAGAFSGFQYLTVPLFATLDMMRQAISKATPAISVPVTDPLTEDKLQALYSLR